MKANKGFLQLRRLEAARDIATLLAASGNRVMLDSATLLLNGELLSHALALSPTDVVRSNGAPKGFVELEEVICGLIERSLPSCFGLYHPVEPVIMIESYRVELRFTLNARREETTVRPSGASCDNYERRVLVVLS